MHQTNNNILKMSRILTERISFSILKNTCKHQNRNNNNKDCQLLSKFCSNINSHYIHASNQNHHHQQQWNATNKFSVAKLGSHQLQAPVLENQYTGNAFLRRYLKRYLTHEVG